jgi:hypothetical protein
MDFLRGRRFRNGRKVSWMVEELIGRVVVGSREWLGNWLAGEMVWMVGRRLDGKRFGCL